MTTKTVSIAQPVSLLVVRLKDRTDILKGYEFLTPEKTWKPLVKLDGKPLTPEEIIRVATRQEKHVFWNPLLQRKKDVSIFERSAA